MDFLLTFGGLLVDFWWISGGLLEEIIFEDFVLYFIYFISFS